MRKLYDIFKKLVELFPPMINPDDYLETNILFRKGRKKEAYQLSTKHILHVTKFCKDVIEFNEAFNDKYEECKFMLMKVLRFPNPATKNGIVLHFSK